MTPVRYVADALREMLRGGFAYWCWLGVLAVLTAVGLFSYGEQLRDGLVVTGMSDQVSWGFYIANFALPIYDYFHFAYMIFRHTNGWLPMLHKFLANIFLHL